MRFTFPLALTFLTIIPWPRQGLAGDGDLARSMFWFPWVGALLGLIYWGAWAGLGRIFPPPAAAALLLALTVIITRGLHLDGLADTMDGLGGGRDPEARLRIMKDSALGAFGAAGLILALLMKYGFFLSLGAGAGSIFLLFPLVSRWGMVLLAYLSPYARKEGGLGEAMTLGVTASTVLGATLGAAALALLAGGLAGLVLMAAAAGVVVLLKFYFFQKLGGITGDVLGAANEILEILTLAGALALGVLRPDVFILRILW